MKTKSFNLDIEAGTTYRRTLRLFTDKEQTNALNITGYTFTAWITRGTYKIEFSINITNALNGVAVMELKPEQTVDALPGSYLWDMLVKLPSGDVKKYFKGEATIHPTGTRLEIE
jgi:hypothetical protein